MPEDGASERMRDKIERRTKARHIMRSAEMAKKHGMKTLKVYMMVGLPDETDDDIDELVGFAKEISKVLRLAYGVAPFVAKRNTPLDGAPFAGIAEVEQRLSRLKLGLRGCADALVVPGAVGPDRLDGVEREPLRELARGQFGAEVVGVRSPESKREAEPYEPLGAAADSPASAATSFAPSPFTRCARM